MSVLGDRMKSLVTCAFFVVLTTQVRAEQIRFTNFDQNHSTIGFAVPIARGLSEVDGKFTSFSADLLFDSTDIAKSTVSVVIQSASINTGIPDRDTDLRSAHFFDVTKYPEIRFTSAQVAKRGDALVVSGTLEMHGVRKPVDLLCQLAAPVTDEKSGKVFIGGSASVTLDRRDFGITWEHTVPGFVGDEVVVTIHLISKLTPRQQPDTPAPPAEPPKPSLR